jgi:hypothetical protein
VPLSGSSPRAFCPEARASPMPLYAAAITQRVVTSRGQVMVAQYLTPRHPQYIRANLRQTERQRPRFLASRGVHSLPRCGSLEGRPRMPSWCRYPSFTRCPVQHAAVTRPRPGGMLRWRGQPFSGLRAEDFRGSCRSARVSGGSCEVRLRPGRAAAHAMLEMRRTG